jgi:hypothetical protein
LFFFLTDDNTKKRGYKEEEDIDSQKHASLSLAKSGARGGTLIKQMHDTLFKMFEIAIKYI